MSLKANLSIILQLHSFRNLALPHKARYALQAHFFQGKAGKVLPSLLRTWPCRSTSSRQTPKSAGT